jgi:hypothetical protein
MVGVDPKLIRQFRFRFGTRGASLARRTTRVLLAPKV